MDSWFAANPLNIPSPLIATPGDTLIEILAIQFAAALRIKRVHLGDAEHTAQITTGQIEQMRRDKVQFLAVLNAMAKEARDGSRLARAAPSGNPVHATAVFAQGAGTIMLPCLCNPFWRYAQVLHGCLRCRQQ
jgi:hypothetical protein